MPRRARLAMPGIPWHIVQRGNNRGLCFREEDDYHVYLDILRMQSANAGCAVHAYALMPNHIHLLVTPKGSDGVAAMMKQLGQRFVQYVNRTYRRTGTLWEGRFRSCLVQEDRYLLECHRYVEQNPVRAELVTHPGGYRWSSYHTYAEGEPDPVATLHEPYLRLGSSNESRQAAYRAFAEVPVDRLLAAEIRAATNGNYVLGSHRFKLEIAAALSRRTVPGKPGRPRSRR